MVLSLGIDPGYVLDRMEIYEVGALLDYQHLRNRDSWEQTRMQAFVAAKCAGAKINGIKEIFSLPWDKEEEKAQVQESDYSQLPRLKALSQSIIESGFIG